jgi:hypothetical protein
MRYLITFPENKPKLTFQEKLQKIMDEKENKK